MAKSIHSLRTTSELPQTLEKEIKPFALSLPDAKCNPSANDFRNLPQNLVAFHTQRRGIRRTFSDSILYTGVTSDGLIRSTFNRRLPLDISHHQLSDSTTTSSSFCSLSVTTTDSSDSSYVLPISASQLSLPEPPDGGWGWVVVFAAFMVHMITDGIVVSFGVLIEDLLNEFQQSVSATSWIGSFSYGVPALVTPIASVCVDRFGCRITCMLGGIISAVGCLIAAFTNSVLHLVFTFGILSGIGVSFSTTSALVIVSMYFDDRRATATGLSISGTGVGALVFAPLVKLLLTLYTWRGTFLLMAGGFLNLTVFGALMRPVETRLERRHRQRLAWLEHMAKESGILSVTNTSSYMNLDVLGRIKLLRDELLSPRCIRSSNVDHMNILHANQNGNEGLNRARLMADNTNMIQNFGDGISCCDMAYRHWNNQHTNAIHKVHKPLELTAIPEGCAESKCVKDTTIGRFIDFQTSEYFPSNDLVHESSGGRIKRSNEMNAHMNFNSVDNYINRTSIISSPLPRAQSHSAGSSFRRSYEVALGLEPTFFKPKRNCIAPDVHFVQKSCQAAEDSVLLRIPKSNGQQAIKVNHNRLHSKVVISNFDRPCDRVDIFYRYSVHQDLQHNHSIVLSLPELHRNHRIILSAGNSESDSSSDSDCMACCHCPVPKPGDTSTNGINSHHPILAKFQNAVCRCDNRASDNVGRRLFRRMCDLRLFSESKFAYFVFSNVLLYFWYNVTYFFLIVHATALGMPETTSALLFSVLGGANMVGEVVVGFLADRESVDALTLYLFMLLACGISTSSVPFLTNFVLLSFYAAVFGFGLAANDALCTILIVEFVGLERLTNGLGICFFCQGVANILGPPFIGYIIDSTSSINPAFIISGIGLALAGLSVVPIIIQRFRRHRARLRRRRLWAERQKASEELELQTQDKT